MDIQALLIDIIDALEPSVHIPGFITANDFFSKQSTPSASATSPAVRTKLSQYDSNGIVITLPQPTSSTSDAVPGESFSPTTSTILPAARTIEEAPSDSCGYVSIQPTPSTSEIDLAKPATPASSSASPVASVVDPSESDSNGNLSTQSTLPPSEAVKVKPLGLTTSSTSPVATTIDPSQSYLNDNVSTQSTFSTSETAIANPLTPAPSSTSVATTMGPSQSDSNVNLSTLHTLSASAAVTAEPFSPLSSTLPAATPIESPQTDADGIVSTQSTPSTSSSLAAATTTKPSDSNDPFAPSVSVKQDFLSWLKPTSTSLASNEVSNKVPFKNNQLSKEGNEKESTDQTDTNSTWIEAHSWRKPKVTNQVGSDNNSAQESTERKPLKDGEITKVIGLVVRVNDDNRFNVLVEEGPYADFSLLCYMNQLRDPTVPIVPRKTKVLLGVKIRCNPDKNVYLTVLWVTVLEYTRLTPWEVCKAIELLDEDTEENYEEFIKKLYFSWRPFLKSLLKYADEFDEKTVVSVLNKVLPVKSFKGNKEHQSRFQGVIELFAAKNNTFLLRLNQLKIYEHNLVKQLAAYVTCFTKNLDAVWYFLRCYYSDDANGVIDLIEKCYSKEFDPSSLTLTARNFRDIPLIPVYEELTGVINKLITDSGDATEQTLLQLESHLVPNRIDGPWDSPEEFLNVHFRLLREECFASIRNRIANVRLDPKNYKQVHRDVKVIGYDISDGTIVVQLEYKPHEMRANLMFGNLLCLDVNRNFSNPIWATVQSSDVKANIVAIIIVGVGNEWNETLGNVSVRLSADVLVKAVLRLMSCQDCVMVESPTYYNAFRPVLERLQSLEEHEFPFCSEILLKSVNPKPSRMNFALGHSNYRMDESQIAAVKASLRDRFSLIQGPPGCGKTFIGKEIIKTMLRFKHFEGPILLLSYKNHALDSLLERCLEFTDQVVRIGGKSTSGRIDQFNLHNLFVEANISKSEFKELQNAKSQLWALENSLEHDAEKFLAEFTTATLLSFLIQSNIGKRQLCSLIIKNFRTNYAEIINHVANKSPKDRININNWPQEQVEDAVSEIMLQESKLAEKLLKNSLRQWFSEADVRKYMPNPHGALFVNSNLSDKTEKEEDEELDKEEMEKEVAERQIGLETKYEFHNIFERSQKLYPNLQQRILSLDVDSRDKDVSGIDDVWNLLPEGRYLLLCHWLREWNKDKDQHFSRNLEVYHRFSKQVEKLQDETNVRFLKTRDIVACTITGCCLRMGMISRVAPSVVIVEEAAEILESQLIAALPPSVKHAVLIGDHKQLPPLVTHHRLRMKYNLGVSIFERLANNGFPVSQLRYHRRGPESLCPLFSRFYDNEIVPLKADPKLPQVLQKLGIMYWWTHNAPAQTPAGGLSFENELEAAMLVGTIQFLIWHGDVRADQISVISGYLGQAKLIRLMLANAKIEGVDVNTIDRFQGDENDFIFLSLTRSASDNVKDSFSPPSLGFLSSTNRACVALSRAKLGLYIFGNSELFESHKVWRPTVQYFRDKGKIGTELQFVASKRTLIFEHPNDFKTFFNKIDFERQEMKIRLQNIYIKDVPPNAREGVHDVTNMFRKKIEELMNKSVLNKRDLGQGRDAHGEKFRYFKVKNVKRIFNKQMYILYLHNQDKIKEESKPEPLKFEVDSMADWLKKDVNTSVNEVFLFHGTNEATARLIQESGFDERLANGGMFGAGTYFAENADKSDQYSNTAPHMMFLARVILGKPYETTCTGKWRRPPPVNPEKPNKLYDCVIAVSSRKINGRAAVARHQEFVVYDRYQCLPEFIIEYERQ